MLEIKNLHAQVEDKQILNGLSLTVKAGEIHAIMGPNGSGKSTLASVLAGKDQYEVTEGTVQYNNMDLLEMAPEDRAREGVFLAFQYPIEIPGVTNANFLKTALNEMRKHKGLEPLDSKDFLKLMKEKMAMVEMDKSMTQRSVKFSRWPCLSRHCAYWMKQIQAWTSMHCALLPTV
jgi:Fe-S cluster assembly ATP-binding protein